MYTGRTLFAQLMDFVAWTTSAKIVSRYGGDHRGEHSPAPSNIEPWPLLS